MRLDLLSLDLGDDGLGVVLAVLAAEPDGLHDVERNALAVDAVILEEGLYAVVDAVPPLGDDVDDGALEHLPAAPGPPKRDVRREVEHDEALARFRRAVDGRGRAGDQESLDEIRRRLDPG